MERRASKRLERRGSSGPYARPEESSGSTGLTSYMEDAALDFKEDSAPLRSISIFGRKKDTPKLPVNWKKAKDKDGKVYYFNTVTQQRSHEVPPPLPPGWKEALHNESGRVYYYHKATRQSTFEFPTQAVGGGVDDEDDDEPAEAPQGFFGRTISKMTGKGKKVDDGMQRSGTMSRGGKKGKAEAKKTEAKEPDGAEKKTVFISCSTLIKEVKLCVEAKEHAVLDSLYNRLTSHEIPADQAVRLLMEHVGSTIVQQAGLSVMNALKGVLPHGWLEYADEASGRPYYYNVHTKVTTWYKPTGAAAPAPAESVREEEEEMAVQIDCALTTHNVAMTGFI